MNVNGKTTRERYEIAYADAMAATKDFRAGRITDDQFGDIVDRAKSAQEAWFDLASQNPAPYSTLDAATLATLRSAGSAPTIGKGLAGAVLAARFDVKGNPSVTVPAFDVVSKSTFPAMTDVARTTPGIVPMGTDSRFLYPLLVQEDAGNATSISDFRQTARTLTGTVERALDATTDKASLDTTLAIVNEALHQEAVTINDIPLALFDSVPQLSAYLNSEGAYQVNKAIDASAFAAIVASSPPFGNTGTGLVAQVRNGIATMRAAGANPSILVVNGSDAAALDLTADAGGFVFPTSATGTSSPLWGLRVVERAGTGSEPPYLIDPVLLGALYIGTMRFDADPYSGFRKNLVTLRVEVNCLMHVRNANGARRIAAT